MTNLAAGNTVMVFHRTHDGSLTYLQEVATGGLGTGPGVLPAFLPPGDGPNPLQSQDSLVLTRDGRFLLAVNAGSSELSVLAVTPEGLRLVDKTSSGGLFPVSVAIHEHLIYVLNEGDDTHDSLGGTPNIAGFTLDGEGRLHEIPRSSRSIGTNESHPADVIFSPDGRVLIVTEKFTDAIDVLRVEADGRLTAQAVLPPNNKTPFGMAFERHGILAITEANSFLEDGRRNAVVGGSTVSTYHITSEGVFEPISSSVPNNQTAVCWIRFTPDGRFAYVSNKGSGSLSSYRISKQGELSLLATVAADTGGQLSGPLDIVISRDGRFLYVLSSFIRTLKGYRIEEDGSLTPIVSIPGMPLTTQGLAAH